MNHLALVLQTLLKNQTAPDTLTTHERQAIAHLDYLRNHQSATLQSQMNELSHRDWYPRQLGTVSEG